MKVWKTIIKILVALAAVAGVVYVAATYGDKIVAWCKKLLRSLPCGKCCDCGEEACTCECQCAEDAPVEEPAQEAPAEEAAPAEESAVVAEENDFEG